jgi:hypothetical protein
MRRHCEAYKHSFVYILHFSFLLWERRIESHNIHYISREIVFGENDPKEKCVMSSNYFTRCLLLCMRTDRLARR